MLHYVSSFYFSNGDSLNYKCGKVDLSFAVMISTCANCPTWSFHETYFTHLSKADSWGFPGLGFLAAQGNPARKVLNTLTKGLHRSAFREGIRIGLWENAKMHIDMLKKRQEPSNQTKHSTIIFVVKALLQSWTFPSSVDTGYFVNRTIWDTFTFRQKTPVGCNTKEMLSVSAKLPENKDLKVLGVLSKVKVDVLSWSLDFGIQSFIAVLNVGNFCGQMVLHLVTSSALAGVGNGHGHGLHKDDPGNETRFGRWISEMMDQWLVALSQMWIR